MAELTPAGAAWNRTGNQAAHGPFENLAELIIVAKSTVNVTWGGCCFKANFNPLELADITGSLRVIGRQEQIGVDKNSE